MTIRAAGFYYDIKNFINDNGITAAGAVGGMGTLGSDCLYNIDHVKLYGAELEAAIRIRDTFRATAAYIYQECEVDETGFDFIGFASLFGDNINSTTHGTGVKKRMTSTNDLDCFDIIQRHGSPVRFDVTRTSHESHGPAVYKNLKS